MHSNKEIILKIMQIEIMFEKVFQTLQSFMPEICNEN
jgi:hypothetical protein